MNNKPARDEAPNAPLKLNVANERWNRENIRRYAFPQPPAANYHLASRERRPDQIVNSTSPMLPDTEDITVVPAGQRRRQHAAIEQTAAPLKVRRPDRRRVFNDTTYPWRCCGRVATAAGQCTGVLVGPRHLLTVSHVVDWTTSKGKIGWLKFEPGYNDGEVFPSAYATQIYSYERIVSPSVDDFEVASDYVVCVLDRDVGLELGWFGSKTYDPTWDEYSYWSQVGYPEDLGHGARPFFEGPLIVKNSWRPGFLERGYGRSILIYASTSSGHSGGPFFAWWDDGPYLVGVISASGALNPVVSYPVLRSGNWVAGGEPLPSLIHQARTEYP